ncbi:MAG: MaoC family dehydratase N-terminal domain-containing protein, partial [Sphingopyxis sp.]|nr:MaoC family dehydratase N-terminal domain-containing protein [Sphingopyxis sp.]
RDDASFLPPVPLPRRMWAGGRVDFLAPIAIGARLVRTTTIDTIAAKRGATGDLLFVTLRHDISADGVAAVREEQNLVYRAAATASPPPAGFAETQSEPADTIRRITPDPVLLFRYSALTFNAHRIHYDRDYARDVEGYAGLVVHGPLIATLLVDLALRETPGQTPRHFSFSAEVPLTDTAPFDLCMARQDDRLRLWSRGPGGRRTMQAELHF